MQPELHPSYPHVSQQDLFRYEQMLKGNEFFRWGQSRGGWGVAKTINPGQLAEKTRIGLIDIPAPEMGRVPRVQNITLIANPTFSGSFAGILRWLIEAGVGTARSQIIVDAQRLQQVSLSAESLRIALFLDDYGDLDAADASHLTVQAAAYASDGNTSTSASVYTVPWHTTAGAQIHIPIPEGATSWMVQGISSAVNRATMHYTAFQESGIAVDAFTGDQLLSAHASGAFIPLQGGVLDIVVGNGEVVDQIDGSIVFQLDL